MAWPGIPDTTVGYWLDLLANAGDIHRTGMKKTMFDSGAGSPHPDVLFSLLLGTFTEVLHLGHEVYQSAFPL